METTECEGCHRQCVPYRTWKGLARQERADLLAAGITGKLTSRFCRRCYDRDRNGIELDKALPVDRDLIAEEWNWIANPWLPDETNAENLAPRLGMTVKALTVAVSELRRAGRVGPARGVAA